jgi:hypothetical protein
MTPKPQVPKTSQPNNASNGTNAPAATFPAAASWSSQTNGKRKVNNGAQSKASVWQAPSKTSTNSVSSSTAKSDEFANKIYTQLAKDGIKPPQWPSNPGARQQRNAMDTFREAHKAYREKARKCLIKADLIDDPDKRRTLDEALVFKGICDEMCPEWEKITRITEHDVKNAEKEEKHGEMVAIPQKMVKRLARSAAGQEASLPMDVRSPAACRRTLNYLINELIPSDERLPTQHNFLWDRTRAIRIDLSMQAPSMGPDEIKDEIYCLETIARFHVTSLHLLSQTGFAAEDFSEQQEIEQLSKTLMSLRQRYKDCADMGVVCENETEFRAYYVLFFAWDSSIKETVESWGQDIATSDAIQTAMCMVESIQNTSKLHGPLAPPAPTEMAVDAASIFFSMVASPQISYTMACFAEIHFNAVRRSILRIIQKAYSRPRDGPKDLTPDFLRRRLRFDTDEEAVSFVEQHGLEFEEEMGRQYLVLNPRQQLKDPRIPHAFSFDIVERKRSQKSLPEVIHQTTYEVPHDNESPQEASDDESLFVAAAPAAAFESEDNAALESELENSETPPAPTLNPSSMRSHFGGVTQQRSPGFAPVNSIFGNPGGSKPMTTSIHTPEQGPAGTKAENVQEVSKKKVKFGGNEYKYIEARSSPQKSIDISSTSSGIFGFPSKDGDQVGTPGASQPNNPSSWFPPNLANPSGTAANTPGGSILSGASTTPSTGFKFPTFGASSDTSTPAAAAANINPSISSVFPPKPDTQQPQSLAAPAQPSPTVFPSPIPQAKSPLFPSGNTMSTGPPVATNAEALVAPSRAQTGPPTTLFSPAATASTPSQPQAKRDPIGEFTRWFICGDRGLMEDHLQSWVVKHLLEDLWENFREAEEERKRKEEDEKSWAEARKFRTYSLRVTYFYRWLDIFRKRRVVKRIQMEKEKARQWNMPENVAKRDAAKKAARDKEEREVVSLLRKNAKEKGREESKLRESVRSQEQSVEDALLATGIFTGGREERAAARHAAMDDDDESETSMLPSEMLYRQESRRRRKHGLAPLNRLMEPPKYKEGSKTAKLRALSTGQDTLSMSTGSLRNSTLSSSYRSSLGFNGSRVAKAKKSQVSDPYWRMKAHGLVQMPNGEYLHESLALPMLREGKRFAGFGDFGLAAAASATSSQSPPNQDSLFDDNPPLPLEISKRSRVSSSPSIISNSAAKRKRGPFQVDDAGEDEDLAAYRSETSASNRKRARSGDSIGSEKDFLSRMESLLQDVENEGKRIQAR